MKPLYYLFLFIIFSSCASYKSVKDVKLGKSTQQENAATQIFLIGNMQGDIKYSQKLASGVVQQFNSADSKDILLFLGDNLNSKNLFCNNQNQVQKELEKLNIQKEIVSKFPGKVIYIPGYSDWKGNQKGLLQEIEILEKEIPSADFIPENSCPLDWVDIDENYGMIVVDSEWYITNWNHNPKMNTKCTQNYTRDLFLEHIEDLIKDHPNKTIIIASHHPLLSMGKRAGYYPPNLFFPLDVLRETSGIIQTDMQFPRYQEFTNELKTKLQYFKNNIILVSAHENNLQCINTGRYKQIISGGGSKPTALKTNAKDFQYAGQGFAVLQLENDKPRVDFYNEKAEFLNNVNLYPPQIKQIFEFQNPLPKTGTTSIYNNETLDKLSKENKKTGKRYREYYKEKLTLPSLDLSLEKGGLTVVGEHDGFDEVNLLLQANDGKEYILRRARNDASMLLQKQFYPELYVEDELMGTQTEKFIYDYYTTQYPFANCIVPFLSKSAKLYNPQSTAYYVPTQSGLGNYNETFQNEICWLEEKVDYTSSKTKIEGLQQVLSTVRMEELWVSNASYKMNEQQVIRNRLFDMWINDWDRESRDFKWAVCNNGNAYDINMISLNHEEAFSKYDGKTLKFLTKRVFPLKKMQSFAANIPNIDIFNQDIFKYDITYLQTSTLEDWLQEAENLKKYLSDKNISNAVDEMPEQLKDKNAQQISENLKKRREHLSEWAEEYFSIVKERAVLTGTMLEDSIKVTRNADKTVNVTIQSPDNKGNYNEYKAYTYNPEVTKEIWIYAFDGKDHIEVLGKNSPIKIYLMGGGQEDRYDIKHKHRVHIFEHSLQKNLYEGKIPKKNISRRYIANRFDKEKFRYNRSFTEPIVHIGVDRGTRLGVQRTWLKNKYTDYKYNILQRLGVEYFTLNNGLAFEYESKYRDFFKIFTFGLDAIATTPSFTRNFFGYGMNTPYDQDRYSFYRYRQAKIAVTPSIIREFPIFGSIGLSFPITEISLKKNKDSFVNDFFVNDSLQLGRNLYYGPELNFNFENADDKYLPNLGLQFGFQAGYKVDYTNEDFNFLYFKSYLSMQYPIIKDRLVFASRINFNYQQSDTVVPLYFATTIGGVAGLRGFRNERFTGDSGFWQVSDIRLKLFDFRPVLLPGSIGISAGFDYGKVWMSSKNIPSYIEADNLTEDFKISYGGGIYFNVKTFATLRAILFHSEEQNRFDVMLGFNF